MARPAEGFKLRPHPITGIQQVRFSHDGRQREYSTGERDSGAASKEAARIYAEVISGRWIPGQQGVRPGTPLDVVAAKWLASLTLDRKTVGQYKMYVRTHWAPYFVSLDRMVTSSVVDYTRARLTQVVRDTVKKELSAMRGFLSFCEEQPIGNPAVYVPPVPKGKAGTTSAHRHKKSEVTLEPNDVEAILARLPERSDRSPRFAVRARYVVAYETGLRPATLDELETPGDYRRGKKRLRIRDEIDKARFGREVPLTPRARRALDSVIAGDGLIFGRHDGSDYLKRAAKAAKIDRASEVSPYDLRHARLTHLVESSGGNLLGVAYIAGHLHVTTTNRYAHPSLKAAERALSGAPRTRPKAARS